MLDFLTHFDGSGRQPRQVQIDALTWLSNNWAKYKVHAIGAPVGSGKSAIARSIQILTGAPIVTPSNILIDQYCETYPANNYLKGKKHYACHYSGLSCADWIDIEEQEPCLNCNYQTARRNACDGIPTFFNPMSLYHLRRRAQIHFEAIIVDEAHLLGPMLVQLCSKKFPKSTYNFPDNCVHEKYLSEWLSILIGKLERLIDLYHRTNAPKEKIKEACAEFESSCILKECLDSEPENYAIWVEEGLNRGKPEIFLNVKPVRVPRFMVCRLLSCDRLILLSGTLLKTDIEDLAMGNNYSYLDLPSPIPKENRPIKYRPMPFEVNFKTSAERMVEEIFKVLNEFPNRNAIIHTTYARAVEWKKYFKKPVLTNTPETKVAVLEKFKKEGGVWLAAGCSEGLDLKDDICRLNIIPHLLRPNLADPVVKKWKALAGGNRRYALQTIKNSVQQYGRSTRDPKDHSITVIQDPYFSNVIAQYGKDVPKYFIEAIQWRKQ